MGKQDAMRFTFADTIAGYVMNFDWDTDTFGLQTSDGREFQVKFTPTTFGELIRNLGEPYQDCTMQMRDMLEQNRYLYVYGEYYPQAGGHIFEAKHVIFVGRRVHDFLFEKPDWWIKQVRQLADFYLRAEFGDTTPDWREYRTRINLSGVRTPDFRQEVDTISRLVYGFATAYLVTGDDRYLEAAESGTKYLRDHLRFVDHREGFVYWYHANDIHDAREHKVFASEFGDDYNAVPMYEQIYALAGPTQTYRATGDPAILSDIEMTMNLFDRFFKDNEQGGYFSHIDPITLDPRSESLGMNRARKNWNSVGDHAPAYLINLWLATGKPEYAEMLAYTADTIEAHFPDDDNSPFVQERFHEDWTHDIKWGWQLNRAVVGHNLKIAWNLMRIHHLMPKDTYEALARKIAAAMPTVGMDVQRGGWYDVMERTTGPGEEIHRFVWHDRKAWWQQEQGILAYLILAGSLKGSEYLRLARESSAFYNAWFLDHEEGGVYFNVLANGLPYLLGNERLKGSHSMSGYHAFELCYLAAVYTNLLITQEPMHLYFKPFPGGLKDNILRVAPDILPPGSIRLEEVTINGERYTDFDPESLTIRLPESVERLNVAVKIGPAVQTAVDKFSIGAAVTNGTAIVTISGDLNASTLAEFQVEMNNVADQQPQRVVFRFEELQSMSGAAVREIVFARQKMGLDVELFSVGAHEQIVEALREADFFEDIVFLEQYDPASLKKQ